MPRLGSTSTDSQDDSSSRVRHGTESKEGGGTAKNERHKSRSEKNRIKHEEHLKAEQVKQLSSKEAFNMEDLYAALDNKGKKPFKKAIMGDIFGSNEEMNKNSLLGMMYNSRIQERIKERKMIGWTVKLLKILKHYFESETLVSGNILYVE